MQFLFGEEKLRNFAGMTILFNPDVDVQSAIPPAHFRASAVEQSEI